MTRLSDLKNLTTGVLLALLGLAALWATSDLATGRPAAADPALLPRLVGIGLVGVGMGVVVTEMLRHRRGGQVEEDVEGIPIDLPVDIPDELRDDESAGPADWRQLAAVAAAIVGYALVAFRLGFLTSTVAFIIGAALLLGRSRHPRSLLVLVIFAVVVASAYHVGFFVLLNVRDPGTPLP